MEKHCPTGRAGRKRARSGAVQAAVVTLLLLAAPHVTALKLASISEDRGHLGLGLLRAVEVVRGRYERAWALVSAAEPTASDLDTALELLQTNAKQWESLEPAVRLWTEREVEVPKGEKNQGRPSEEPSSENGNHQQRPGVSETTSRIYEEAASLLAHNRAVLGQALARSGRTDRGIEELEAACPEILEYQQNAQGRRDSKSWLHCYANLAEMYKSQQRFEEASTLLARMPWLPSAQQASAPPAGEGADDASAPETPHTDDTTPHVPSTTAGGGFSVEEERDPDFLENDASESSTAAILSGAERNELATGAAVGSPPPGEVEAASDQQQTTGPSAAAATANSTSSSEGGVSKEGNGGGSGGGGGRSDTYPARGTGAARVAGLNKAAVAASAAAAAAAESAAAAAGETGAETAARALAERHAESMRASMNEVVGELAVTAATRPAASQEWLDSRVAAAEEILAFVRAGVLAVESLSEYLPEDIVEVPVMSIGAPGHADILREASHYLSAIKGVAAQGWEYVDNELHRMERHPAQAVKPGFQSRREVIHTFRYLLMKARQYASENQSQATTASGSPMSGSRSRRKERGRKASASSKAPRKGGAARKSSSSSSSPSSPSKSDGLFTLFVGAGLALLVAAVSSGRGGGQGRRREVVRQRAATRAAKTVGSYVEPPQRGALASLFFHLWGNMKRSWQTVSAHAMNSAIVTRALLLSACAVTIEKLRAACDSTRSGTGFKVLTGAGTGSAPATKKVAGAAQGHHGKQRSKKNAKKVVPAHLLPLTRQPTATLTPPASPHATSELARDGEDQGDVAPTAPAAVSPARGAGGGSADVAQESHAVAAVGCAVTLKEIVEEEGEGGVAETASPAMTPAAGAAPASPAATPASSPAAAKRAAEITAGVPFPDVMTVEQVQAMVEEDERAWEQARLSENLHSRADAAAAALSQRSSAADGDGDGGRCSDDGWSEVGNSGGGGGGGGSRGRASVGGGGRVLSMRNVRAVARASRPSSPGSDPATTTSASSSDCSDGSKETPNIAHTVGGRGGARSSNNRAVAARAMHATTRGSAVPRASSKPATRGLQPGRGGSVAGPASGGGGSTARPGRPHQGRGTFSKQLTRESDPACPRPSRASCAPWATARTATATATATQTTAAAQTPRGSGKPRQSSGPSKRASGGGDSSRAKGGPTPLEGSSSAADRPKVAPLPRRAPRQPESPSAAVAVSEVEVKSAEESLKDASTNETPLVAAVAAVETEKLATPAPPTPAPVAWTNTPSHPLGLKPKSPALPPASEPPRPPPQHQQHWQRQQIRQQEEQRQQQQQQQHFFHHPDQPLLAMAAPAAPIQQQQHQHVTGHHFGPPPPPPPPPQAAPSLPPHQHQHQAPQELMMPQQYLAPSEEGFPPPVVLMSAVAPSAVVAAPMIYQPHPMNMPSSPPAVSPGGGSGGGEGGSGDPHYHVQEGSYGSPGSNSGGAVAGPSSSFPPPSQMVMLPPPHEQQPGRFSPSTLMPVEDGSGGASPMYGVGPPVGYAPGGVGGGDAGDAMEGLMGALCWQVEYYFSADNLVRDAYLRGLMDSEGFVAVSKIMVFNRVRSMTSDISVLIEAMGRSTDLELMEQDHNGEARVRTSHSPLHWTREQVHTKGPSAVTTEREQRHHNNASYEPEHVPYGENFVGPDEGVDVSREGEPDQQQRKQEGEEVQE